MSLIDSLIGGKFDDDTLFIFESLMGDALFGLIDLLTGDRFVVDSLFICDLLIYDALFIVNSLFLCDLKIRDALVLLLFAELFVRDALFCLGINCSFNFGDSPLLRKSGCSPELPDSGHRFPNNYICATLCLVCHTCNKKLFSLLYNRETCDYQPVYNSNT